MQIFCVGACKREVLDGRNVGWGEDNEGGDDGTVHAGEDCTVNPEDE